jgi:hypothetical protein
MASGSYVQQNPIPASELNEPAPFASEGSDWGFNLDPAFTKDFVGYSSNTINSLNATIPFSMPSKARTTLPDPPPFRYRLRTNVLENASSSRPPC